MLVVSLSRTLPLAALAAAALTAGCATRPGAPVVAEVLYNTLQCGADVALPALSWIDDAAALDARYRAFSRVAGAVVDAPAIDFDRAAVLLVAMGRRPSSGYRLNYVERRPAEFHGGGLRVPLAWTEPQDPAAEVALTTDPCLLLRLPRADYRRVEVIDFDGVRRVTLPGPDDSTAAAADRRPDS